MIAFITLLLLLAVITNYRAYTKYKEAKQRLQEVEKRYQDLSKELEIKEKELEALRNFIEQNNKRDEQ